MDATVPAGAIPFDFAKVRPMFGGSLNQGQVDGINSILSAFSAMGDGNLRHLAYMLATAKWETMHTMQPVREASRGKGLPYGRKDATGQIPYGRGLVQLTWTENYAKADKRLGLNGALIKNYDLALDPKIAAEIMVRGMDEGWFTGKKLSDYPDFTNMRRVINSLDQAQTIALYANTFLGALS
jgi:hypothetical protein